MPASPDEPRLTSWPLLESTPRGHFKVFDVREDLRQSPTTGRAHTFYVIESSDWVNIVPLTPDGRIVFVKQVRHATDEVTLEIPGGMVDAGEDPAKAARREMQEETGYDSAQIIPLGAVAPNPAILNNRCHTYLALEAHPVGPPQLDGAEEIQLTHVDPAEVPGLILSGGITHSLVVAAFYLFDQWHRAQGRPPSS
ncbi:MAG: NUDIX hydrolase [Bacteroidota bacterium]